MILKLKKKYKDNVKNKSGSSHSYKLNEQNKRNVIRHLITKECSNAFSNVSKVKETTSI
uniref:Uncharacterized protein n=1 Tax=Rhizophagus irregularis (strain DAOM 181602 / DAOM 197198 / MUCL 43194) TaxID=747089 RepID=U9UH95_RHIID